MGGNYSMQPSQAENRLSMAYYVCVSTMLLPLYVSSMPCNRSFWPPQACMFSVSLPTRACLLHNPFCLVFSHKFNIVSGLFVHQSLTLPQKIDSRGGLFWCKTRVACECNEMNIYLKKSPFAPTFGPFIAKYGAFWCKIACILVLITLRFDAKSLAFWCKTQGKMVQNAVQFAAKRKSRSIKIRCNCINKTFKNHEKLGPKGQNGR